MSSPSHSYPHQHVYEEALAKHFSRFLIRPLCTEYFSFIIVNCKCVLFEQSQKNDFNTHFPLSFALGTVLKTHRSQEAEPSTPNLSNIASNAMTLLQLDLNNQKPITERKWRFPQICSTVPCWMISFVSPV